MNTSTSTTEILKGKHSVDNAIEGSAKLKVRNDPLPRTEGSKRKRGQRVCAENGTVPTPSTGMVREEKLSENGMGENRNRKVQIDYSKSKNKTVNSRFRSSKRLAGLKPEVAVNLELSEQVLRAAARKSGESEAKPSPPDNLSHSFPSNVELSNRSKMPLEDQIVPDNQSVKQETDKKDEENIESQLLSPFGDSWSDPSLDFVVKTLTGSILSKENLAIQSLENSVARSLETTNAEVLQKRQCTSVSADNGTVSTPSTEILREENLEEKSIENKRNIKRQYIPKVKKEFDLPRRSSKRLEELKLKTVVNCVLSEQAHGAATGKSGETEVKPLQTISTQITDHDLRGTKLSDINEKALEDQAVPEDQPARPETEMKDQENLGSEVNPSRDSWSDPCLEFAFKTLTGALVVENNVAITQGYFQNKSTPLVLKLMVA
ncbi:uncharacterized protein LOC114312118 [Camellia sinensis]|uniref:uncharacterized protein LOC114312118 n=1 Tax=Camellia sinensis TaxID=4442 RepID=UPI0010365C1F|nr:uncharacterized protein LOC114312118 [Camellia sinensis]XP_028114107.1 uncharacterized protein LOC114312118 [Camellia sinensis]